MLVRRVGERHEVTVTSKGVARVELLAAIGLSNTSIAAACGVTPGTLKRAAERQPEVALAIARGRQILEQELAELLLAKARNGETVAQIYLSKARCGWRDQGPQDGDGLATVNIQVINLPRSLTPAEFAASLDVPSEERPGG